jgi:cytochrome oxidase assembly protein ShyY1
MRRIPLIPTIIVLLAVATMIALGMWQLRRADEKAALIARYELASRLPAIDFPATNTDTSALFRRASGVCLTVEGLTARAGSNRAGDTGFRHLAQCRAGEGIDLTVDYGWSRKPDKAPWGGGAVTGVIGPDADHKILLVADTPAPGLEASAAPDMRNIPDNHLGYAIQWFCFATAALVIYGLALRRRLVASEGNQG